MRVLDVMCALFVLCLLAVLIGVYGVYFDGMLVADARDMVYRTVSIIVLFVTMGLVLYGLGRNEC